MIVTVTAVQNGKMWVLAGVVQDSAAGEGGPASLELDMRSFDSFEAHSAVACPWKCHSVIL